MSEFDVYRRQVVTYIDGPRAERINDRVTPLLLGPYIYTLTLVLLCPYITLTLVLLCPYIYVNPCPAMSVYIR